jgi:hypothetical protein
MAEWDYKGAALISFKKQINMDLPALVADNIAPICIPNSSWVDAMDYYMTSKLFDALTDYSFYCTIMIFVLAIRQNSGL